MSNDEEMSQIWISAYGMKITIEGESNKFFKQDLYTAAIVGLIEEADTHGWEKELLKSGMSGEVTPAEQFYASVLSSVARHYAVDAHLPHDMEVASVLVRLIGELFDKERLGTIIRSGSWSEEDGNVFDE